LKFLFCLAKECREKNNSHTGH